MKKYLYQSHLGNLFWNDNKIDDEYLYCEECGDYDEYLGEASNTEEAKALIDKVSHLYRDDKDADEEDKEFCQYTDEHIKELLEEFELNTQVIDKINDLDLKDVLVLNESCAMDQNTNN